MVRRAVAVLVAAMALAGCAPRYELTIYNVDRGPVQVVVNGSVLGHLTCLDAPLVLVPNGSAPRLPWAIEVVGDDGARLGPATFDGATWVDQALLIRDVGLIAVPPAEPLAAAYGPTRTGCPGVRPEQLPAWSASPGP